MKTCPSCRRLFKSTNGVRQHRTVTYRQGAGIARRFRGGASVAELAERRCTSPSVIELALRLEWGRRDV